MMQTDMIIDKNQIDISRARATMSKGNEGNEGNDGRDGDSGTVTLTRTKTQKPSMYKVLLLNDDYTPMEFVIYVLQRFFSKSAEDATKVMLHVHQSGVGICGVFTYEVAETKVTQVMDMARQHDHPLQCTMEKD
jgi:ATP-dependent Clp protease adaptor protein ClpS